MAGIDVFYVSILTFGKQTIQVLSTMSCQCSYDYRGTYLKREFRRAK